MKIYFCGSIHGGRNDADLYAEIIEELKTNYGQVLTEFVGSKSAAQGSYYCNVVFIQPSNQSCFVPISKQREWYIWSTVNF